MKGQTQLMSKEAELNQKEEEDCEMVHKQDLVPKVATKHQLPLLFPKSKKAPPNAKTYDLTRDDSDYVDSTSFKSFSVKKNTIQKNELEGDQLLPSPMPACRKNP
jgi:hypothetical protein